MGPRAGDEGGKVVVAGRPREVARAKGSRTGRYLAEVLAGEGIAPARTRT
jgi:excinuclease ABC subunit A